MSNFPQKPGNPYAKPGCHPDGIYNPGQPCMPPTPHDCCPPPPPPPCPPEYPIAPPPGFGQVPPVPSVLEGSSLYEAMNVQTQRVNQCIAQWNKISANCFEYMKQCVAAARMNDVYYSDCEVNYQEGYEPNDGCTFSLIEKKAVDKNNQPIRVRLVPAYDNTTNSGLKQPIFDVSFIKSANMVITAVPADAQHWIEPAMLNGAPIPGTMPINDDGTEVTGYVYGFNRNGVLRWFGNNVTLTTLEQNQMVDVIGACTPILNDGKVTEMAEAMTSQGAITAIGFRSSDGSVFFFQCSAQDQPGMQGINVATLLQQYGCTTAVITSFIAGDQKNFSNGMLYMGQMCQSPQGGLEPNNLAYWVISKGPCFQNEFQKTIADLVQTTGRNGWRNYLLGVEVSDFNDRIIKNAEDIANEIARATEAEKTLQDNIDAEIERAKAAEQAETDRATQAEAELQQNINAEQNRAEQAEKLLQDNINAEVYRATTAEQGLDQKIIAETTRATAAENGLAADIAAEKLRAQTRENEIQTALDQEIAKRIAADNDIINAIEQEVLARRAADTALQNSIDAVKNELDGDIQGIQDQINGFTSGQTNLPYLKLTGGNLTGNLTLSSGNTVTLGRGPTTDMEAATKAYVDAAVAGGGGAPGEGATKEYVDQQIANVQTQVDEKVSKSGDSMTGDLNMGGNSIVQPVLESSTGIVIDNGAGGPGRVTNVAAPTSPTDATNKQYVDDSIAAAVGEGDFVPTTGGSMTGDLNMDGSSVINFNDPAARLLSKKALAKAITQGAVNQGSVYNDGTAIVVKSATGQVMLKGTGLSLSDGEGNYIPVTGISEIDKDGLAMVKFDTTQTELMGPVAIVNAAGEGAKLSAGIADVEALDVGQAEIRQHTGSDGTPHLDINVGTSVGALYVNRTNNGTLVEGGSGELHVTEIHAPNQLNLRPGTNVNLGNTSITQVMRISPSQNNTLPIVNQNNTATQFVETSGVKIGSVPGTTIASIYFNNNGLRLNSENTDTIDVVSNRLINVKPGENDNDAATVGQLGGGFGSTFSGDWKEFGIYWTLTSGFDVNATVLATLSTSSTSPSYSNIPLRVLGLKTKKDKQIIYYIGSGSGTVTFQLLEYNGVILFKRLSGDASIYLNGLGGFFNATSGYSSQTLLTNSNARCILAMSTTPGGASAQSYEMILTRPYTT